MIRVNLLPGGKKGPSGPKFAFKLPEIGGLPTDRWVLAAVALAVLGLGAVGYLYTTTNAQHEELTLQVEEAVQDSIRFADLIAQTEELQARRDSIAEKVAIIQEIDADRYVWPHIMDQVAQALPDFTWLTQVVQVSLADRLDFRITGRAGNNFAVTRFMRNLEASPFIRDVRLISTTQVLEQGQGGSNLQSVVHQFQLDAAYEQPPSDVLETVPLFDEDPGSS